MGGWRGCDFRCTMMPDDTDAEAMMSVMLRRFRGVVGMAIMWGAAFAVVGAAYAVWRFNGAHVASVWIDGRDVTPPAWLVAVRGARILAPWGVLAGTCFALGLIAIAARRSGWRRTDALPSVGSAGAWGVASAIALPLATVAAASLGILSGPSWHYGLPVKLLGAVAVAGGGLAAGLVAIARKPLSARLSAPHVRPLPPDPDVRT